MMPEPFANRQVRRYYTRLSPGPSAGLRLESWPSFVVVSTTRSRHRSVSARKRLRSSAIWSVFLVKKPSASAST